MTYRHLIALTVVAVPLTFDSFSASAQQPAPAASPQQFAAPGAQPGAVAPVPLPGVAPYAAPQPGGGQLATGPLPPTPPFQLSDIEQQFVRQTLQMWEANSAKVENFNADFERWDYDEVMGPGKDVPRVKSTGTLSFSKPDKGSFKIDKISRWTKKDPQNAAPDAPGDWLPQPDEIGERWVCDGKAIYEYNHRDKQLVVNQIPENMRGQNIVDGPFPFLFGAQADKLMQRYWIRTKTSDESQIWLEAYPRWQSDAVNYNSVDVMLDRKSMQPKALQVNLPGGQQKHVYIFKETKVNETNLGSWFTGLFSAPRTPIGWTRVMAESGAAPQAAAPSDVMQR